MDYVDVSFGAGVTIGENVVIEPGVRIGNRVHIGHQAVIKSGTQIGDGTVIGEFSILGKAPMANQKMARKPRQQLTPLHIDRNVKIGARCIIYKGVSIAEGVLVGDATGIREQIQIGSHSVVGRNVMIEPNTSIGRNVTIQTSCYITADMLIEDHAFLGPCCSTSNDKYMGRGDRKHRGPIIRQAARIGNNASLLPGIIVGARAVVGAGAVVTRDVEQGITVVGNPAKPL